MYDRRMLLRAQAEEAARQLPSRRRKRTHRTPDAVCVEASGPVPASPRILRQDAELHLARERKPDLNNTDTWPKAPEVVLGYFAALSSEDARETARCFDILCKTASYIARCRNWSTTGDGIYEEFSAEPWAGCVHIALQQWNERPKPKPSFWTILKRRMLDEIRKDIRGRLAERNQETGKLQPAERADLTEAFGELESEDWSESVIGYFTMEIIQLVRQIDPYAGAIADLVFDGQFRYVEVAELMHNSPAAIRMRLNRALKKLDERLEKKSIRLEWPKSPRFDCSREVAEALWSFHASERNRAEYRTTTAGKPIFAVRPRQILNRRYQRGHRRTVSRERYRKILLRLMAQDDTNWAPGCNPAEQSLKRLFGFPGSERID